MTTGLEVIDKKAMIMICGKLLRDYPMQHDDIKFLLEQMEYNNDADDRITLGYWDITDFDEALNDLGIELSDDDIEPIIMKFEEDYLMSHDAFEEIKRLLIEFYEAERQGACICAYCGSNKYDQGGKCQCGEADWVTAQEFEDYDDNKNRLLRIAERLCISVDDLAYRVMFLDEPRMLTFYLKEIALDGGKNE